MTIYIIPNFECNLCCPHCDLSQRRIPFNSNLFMNQISSMKPTDNIILFGGEPTLYEDRFEMIMSTKKVKSVSTNLLHLSDKVWELIKEDQNLSIGTSWNLQRFAPQQEQQWLKNLENLASIDRRSAVLITLTEDLIADSSYQQIHRILHKIQDTDGADKILFEHYIGEYATEDFNMRCDDWLCRMHSDWNYQMRNAIEDKVLDWNCDCSDVMTLLPNGELKAGCPQDTMKNRMCLSCLSCDHAIHCRPCALQHSCSFPKKLYDLVKKESRLKR